VSFPGVDHRLLSWTSLGSWLMSDRLRGRQAKVVIGVVLLGIAAKMIWGLL